MRKKNLQKLQFDTERITKDILNTIENFKHENNTTHPYDIAEHFISLREANSEEYYRLLKKLPHELFAEVLCELPEYIQEEISELLSSKKLADITSKMDTDDAVDFIQNIQQENLEIANNILDNIEQEEKDLINQLISYNEYETGSYMQPELFSAKITETIGDAIQRLKELKNTGKIDNIWYCHVTDINGTYFGAVGLEELIIFDHSAKFDSIPIDKFKNYVIHHKADIKDAIEMVTNYNLSSLPVIDSRNILLGRITSDDIYDIIEDSATEQIYNMAGVNEDAEQDESIFEIGKSRALWLGLNLVTAIAASLVIGIFDTTIQSLVALAILMPIVASMGGNAGTQSLTVTVRQIAIGEIDLEDAKKTIIKEVLISLANGFIFALVIGLIAYLWFSIPMLGVVIGLSMILNLVSAGFFGSFIPLVLERLKIDPAIGSTVLLTTVTDIIGFFSFLGLASIILV